MSVPMSPESVSVSEGVMLEWPLWQERAGCNAQEEETQLWLSEREAWLWLPRDAWMWLSRCSDRHNVFEIPEQNDPENSGNLFSGGSDIESEDGLELILDDHHRASSPTTKRPPQTFIEVIHHPHSRKHTPTIIYLDQLIDNGNTKLRTIPEPPQKPWAPFRTRADFEFTEQVVTKCIRKDTVDILLMGFHGRWAQSTTITLRDYQAVLISLEAARKFGVPFWDGNVEHTFQSHTYTFEFKFRDTWEWILELVCDPTLSEQIMWYPVQRSFNNCFRIVRLYDELNSGEAWWEIQSSLPQEDGLPHCYLPLHLWLDKSKVSEKVKMHPIIIHPGFLPSAIRNGSGNGGGVLIGYMPIVGDPNKSIENEDDTAASVEIAQFKQEVQHKNAFWQLANSDPYAAYSYDMLHAFDSGEWGKHQWPLLLKILNALERERLSRNMDRTPRWCGLKHFKAVASTDFADGNIVDILPVNSTFIHCIRLLGVIRAIGGLSIIREDQIEYLESCLPQYEKYCITIAQQHGKNYNYPKHHSLMHLPEDLRAKATTENYSTRPGEGFQQEVQQAYNQTNFRNAESQMAKIDENQEVIARIRMSVDDYDMKESLFQEELNSTDGPLPPKINLKTIGLSAHVLPRLVPKVLNRITVKILPFVNSLRGCLNSFRK
ncbi:hypothetical protein M422DRAFT_267894 [Sphaerobolus stellatus SS14]|uniref:Uncharacterized protein n=1 Tax=Sphaerobolus stellatus (strain SS14) TaxID=990650 RepID=A0A0C9U835_SPHS4|nr:hypothetical protein M422DRAFT_267894 [Sphaerobolus stellatus SS14]